MQECSSGIIQVDTCTEGELHDIQIVEKLQPKKWNIDL